MKKILAILMVCVMVFALAACGTNNAADTGAASSGAVADQGSSPAPETAGRVIGFTAMDNTNPFHLSVKNKLQEAFEANGDTFIAVDGKLNQATQNDGIEDLIAQNVDVIILNPVDSVSVEAALDKCAEAGIPVINYDSPVANLELVETVVAGNHFMGGQLCGQEIVKLYPDGAKICIIENPLAESVVQRVLGLEDGIKGSKSEIIDRKSIASMDVVLSTAEDMMQTNPDVDVFWGLNDDVSLIILGAVESAGLADKIRVFSVDGSPSGKKSIAAGGLYASPLQSSVKISAQIVDCTYELFDGKTLEPAYSVDMVMISPDNVNEMDLENWE